MRRPFSVSPVCQVENIAFVMKGDPGNEEVVAKCRGRREIVLACFTSRERAGRRCKDRADVTV